MIEYRKLDEISADYFSEHPEEIEDFLNEIFAEYAQDGDSAALLLALRVIARVKGLSTMAEEIGMTRQGLQKHSRPKATRAWIISMPSCGQWATSLCPVVWKCRLVKPPS